MATDRDAVRALLASLPRESRNIPRRRKAVVIDQLRAALASLLAESEASAGWCDGAPIREPGDGGKAWVDEWIGPDREQLRLLGAKGRG